MRESAVTSSCSTSVSTLETAHVAVWSGYPWPDVWALQRELDAKQRPNAHPDFDAPGGSTLSLTDPSDNTLRLCRVSLGVPGQLVGKGDDHGMSG